MSSVDDAAGDVCPHSPDGIEWYGRPEVMSGRITWVGHCHDCERDVLLSETIDELERC
jgi:hypothetical protein